MVNHKAEIISKIYNDLSGFGSIQQTFAEARKIDKTITCLLYTSDAADE